MPRTCSNGKRRLGTAPAARARRGLRRLPALLQRLPGGTLHRDGGSAFRPRVHHLGPTRQNRSPEVTEDWEAMKEYRKKDGHSCSLRPPPWPLLIRNGDIVPPTRAIARRHLRSKTKPSRASAQTWTPRRTPKSSTPAGKLVFPGFIDPHVHIYLPFMATFAKDTHETGEHRGADRRHHHLHRDVLPLAPRRCARRLPAVERQSGRQQRLRLHLPHVGDASLDDQTEGQLARDRRRRHRFLQDLSRLQEFLRRRRRRDVPDAEAGAKKLGVIVTAHCENAELVGRLQQIASGAGQDRARVARAEPPGIGGGRRHESLRHVPGEHRGGRICRASFLEGRAGCGDGAPNRAA